MKKYIVRITLLVALIALLVGLRYVGIMDYFTLDYIIKHKLALQTFLQERYWYAVGMYILVYALLVLFALPVTIVMNVAGGFFLGVIPTILYALIGATIGSVGCFLAVRYLLGNYLRERYASAYKAFDANFAQYGVWYLLSLHFFPVTPFALINVLAALSSIRLWLFALITAIGILPALSVYAFSGTQLHALSSSGDMFSWPIVLALSLLAGVSLVPLVLRTCKII